jgi:hypothetical protein
VKTPQFYLPVHNWLQGSGVALRFLLRALPIDQALWYPDLERLVLREDNVSIGGQNVAVRRLVAVVSRIWNRCYDYLNIFAEKFGEKMAFLTQNKS